MSDPSRHTLLARLAKGPLDIADFAEVSASKASLRVRIYQLREAGFGIETEQIPNGNRRPRARYRLIYGACPCCNREMVA